MAVFCNNYPNVDVSFEIQDADDVAAGDPVTMVVKLEREIEEEEMDDEEVMQLGVVSAPLFPKEKREGWWIVVGDTKTNSLLSLKRISLQTTHEEMHMRSNYFAAGRQQKPTRGIQVTHVRRNVDNKVESLGIETGYAGIPCA